MDDESVSKHMFSIYFSIRVLVYNVRYYRVDCTIGHLIEAVNCYSVN